MNDKPEEMTPAASAKKKLIRQLQMAYSGELAAALAYRGHHRSVSNAEERARIVAIEEDEWHHRQLVGWILLDLGAAIDPLLERRARFLGTILGALCHVGGWFAPMYGAGRLEKKNVREYEDAADYATQCGRTDLIECLLTMAEVEWDHELYFREQVSKHYLSRFFGVWAPPPAREEIRASYQRRLQS